LADRAGGHHAPRVGHLPHGRRTDDAKSVWIVAPRLVFERRRSHHRGADYGAIVVGQGGAHEQVERREALAGVRSERIGEQSGLHAERAVVVGHAHVGLFHAAFEQAARGRLAAVGGEFQQPVHVAAREQIGEQARARRDERSAASRLADLILGHREQFDIELSRPGELDRARRRHVPNAELLQRGQPLRPRAMGHGEREGGDQRGAHGLHPPSL
jgi:hypothetical protein